MKGMKAVKDVKVFFMIFIAFMTFIVFMTFTSAQQTEVLVRIETAFGQIDLAIDTKRAPITAANFLKYVDAGLYDGGRFHRASAGQLHPGAPESSADGVDPGRHQS
jgi:cyclophilin type peptidyl-prolyl cis-trans isomerase/CLD